MSTDTSDNCNLAFGHAECIEVVNARDTLDEDALGQLEETLKSPLFTNPDATLVGAGWFDCGGSYFWTVLAGGAGGTGGGTGGGDRPLQPVEVPPSQPAAVPAAPKEPSSLWKWMQHFSQPASK